MAILEKDTGHYYRVLFDECMIKGNSVIVAYEIYSAESEREKERQREQAWRDYANNTHNRLNSLYDEIMAGVEQLGLQPADVMSETEEGKIDQDKYPDLRALQDQMNTLENLHNDLSSRFYAIGATASDQEEVLSEVDAILTEKGFDAEWVNDPIQIAGKAQLYAGEYNGEPITHEFYYNRLKSYMNDSIEDC